MCVGFWSLTHPEYALCVSFTYAPTCISALQTCSTDPRRRLVSCVRTATSTWTVQHCQPTSIRSKPCRPSLPMYLSPARQSNRQATSSLAATCWPRVPGWVSTGPLDALHSCKCSHGCVRSSIASKLKKLLPCPISHHTMYPYAERISPNSQEGTLPPGVRSWHRSWVIPQGISPAKPTP